MRIAIYLYGLSGGGATRRTLALARGFREQGLEVDLVLIDAEGALANSLPKGIRLRVLALPRAKFLFRTRRRKVSIPDDGAGQACLDQSKLAGEIAGLKVIRFVFQEISNGVGAALRRRTIGFGAEGIGKGLFLPGKELWLAGKRLLQRRPQFLVYIIHHLA